MNWKRYEDLRPGDPIRVAAHPLPAVVTAVERDGDKVTFTYRCADGREFTATEHARGILLA